MTKLECTKCGAHIESDHAELLASFKASHDHSCEQTTAYLTAAKPGETVALYDGAKWVKRTVPEDKRDEFSEIFEEIQPVMSIVHDRPNIQGKFEIKDPVKWNGGIGALTSEPRKMNAGYRHKRDQLEKHLLTQTVYRFQDNVTVMDFLNFVDLTLKAYDDAHTKSGVGPYD